MTTTNNEEKWIGTNEAAEFLGVKPATIRDWIRKGKIFQEKKLGRRGSSNILNLRNGLEVVKLQIIKQSRNLAAGGKNR